MEDDFDIDTFLRLECNTLQQEQELNRILARKQTSSNAETENPFDILSLIEQQQNTSGNSKWTARDLVLSLKFPPSRTVQLAYRKKSLLVHPDKNTSPKAQDAFEMVDRAKRLLTDSGEEATNWRKVFLVKLRDARNAYLSSLKQSGQLPHVSVPKDAISQDPIDRFVQENTLDPNYLSSITSKNLVEKIFLKLEELEHEAETRDRLREKNENERLKELQDKQTLDRKRKAEADKEWEASRDKRVDSWRSFQNKQKGKSGKKKKTKDGLPVLG